MPRIRPAESPVRSSDGVDAFFRGVGIGLACLALALPTPLQAPAPVRPAGPAALAVKGPSPQVLRRAEFGDQSPSSDVRQLADWIADSRDNADSAFVIVDKLNAQVLVFDATARLKGASPVLLGAAPGDHTVAGIGSRPIAAVRPEERTTPAGRFVAQEGRNAQGEDVIWIDHEAAVSMHRVRVTDPKEHRLERLATPGADDNRISYGCINVPVDFYEARIRPTFAHHPALVYVLPEVRSLQEVFPSHDALSRPLARSRFLP